MCCIAQLLDCLFGLPILDETEKCFSSRQHRHATPIFCSVPLRKCFLGRGCLLYVNAMELESKLLRIHLVSKHKFLPKHRSQFK